VARRELARVVGRHARSELVVLDELGCLALRAGVAELVFQVRSERLPISSVAACTRPKSPRRVRNPTSGCSMLR
jgi:hypothetical protein